MLCIYLYVAGMSVVYAESSTKFYDVESANILYDISGGGVLTPESNLTIEGVEKFYIKEWGVVSRSELERIETVSGAIKERQIQKSLKQYDHGVLFDVDFEKQKISSRHSSQFDREKIDLKDMKPTGQTVIATYLCELWESDTRRVCLYRGIPLLDEKHYLGLEYVKRARSVSMDINLSKELFTLPDFPIIEDALMHPTMKTTKFHANILVSDKIINSIRDVNSTDRSYLKLRNALLEGIFKKQKVALPKMLKSMQRARACLYAAQVQEEAKMCLKEFMEIMASFNQKTDTKITSWRDESKEKILDYFEENIGTLEVDMPCIKRAKSFSDLSACMK